MSAYTWMTVLILLAALLMGGNVKGNKKFIFVAFLLLFCVMGLRDVTEIGNDSSSSYLSMFYETNHKTWSDLKGKGEYSFNIGFSYLLRLGFIVTNGDYQLFIVLLSAFLMFSYGRFVSKYSPDPVMSVVCFLGLIYFVLLFDVLKQAVAMAILLFAYDAIIDKKPVKFILITLFAALFHFPALVFLPAYWIGRMKVGRSYLILLAILLIITFVFRDRILRLMLSAYGSDDAEATMDGVRFLRNKTLIMIVILIGAVIIRPPKGDNTVYNSLLMFAGIATVLQTFCGYNNIFERLADYYFHTAIVFIPLALEPPDKNTAAERVRIRQLASSVIPIALYTLAVWRFLSFVNNSTLLSPYKFFWQ